MSSGKRKGNRRSTKVGEGGIHPHCNGKSPETSENTGVAALHCVARVRNRLKVKGMDEKWRLASGERGVPYPGYFAKCAEAIDFKYVGGNACLKV